MVEVPRSASLHWTLLPEDRERVNNAILNLPPTTCRSDRIRLQYERDPLMAFDATSAKQRRHSKHWAGLHALGPTVPTLSFFFRQTARNAVYRVLLRGHISVRSWRVQHSIFGWDEALFRAVFGDLGDPTETTILPSIKNSAVSFESAAASNYVYRSQILVRTGVALETWCAFETMTDSSSHWSFGCAIKQQSFRFVLELAAILIINNNRIQGKRSEVRLLISTAVINNAGVIHEPLPRSNISSIVPVLLDDNIRQRAQVYMASTSN